jgi:thiol-disulfide isomerase/thioredoxin
MTARSHDAEVLLFSSPHCSSCRAVRPTASEIAAAYDGSVTFREVDATTDRATASRYGVKGVPTFVAIHDDVEVGRFVGAGTRSDIARLFSAADSGDRTRRGISSTDRILRLAVATAFAGAALLIGAPVLWLFAGGATVFALWDLIGSGSRK